MRQQRLNIAAMLACGLLVTFAGCTSLTSSNAVAQVLPYDDHEATHGGDLFVSDFYVSEILIYPAHVLDPSPSGSITASISNPYNLAVDDAGTLYVQNNNNTITEYKKGKTKPFKTLGEPSTGIGTGICVTVGADGTVYAVDHYRGQVYEFKNGSTSPSVTLNVSEAFGVALDRENDLYVGWSDHSSQASGHVMEFKPGSTTGKDLGITVRYSGGLAVDSRDHLLVGDQGNSVIDIFKRGKTAPFRTINTYPSYPYQFAFDRDERHLYLVSGTPAEVYVYDYSSGSLAWTVTQGLPGSSGYAEGVALGPAAPQ